MATPRPRRLQTLARQLAAATHETGLPVVLGHGSGSFGHPAAASHSLQGGISSHRQLTGVSRTQNLARQLHALVVERLRAAGAHPFSLAPGSFLVAESGSPSELFLEPLLRALDLGLLPVVFGDVVTDRRQGVAICSTEAVFLALALALHRAGRPVARVLWLGDTPGLLGPGGETIPLLQAGDWPHHRAKVQRPRGTDVTGGMALRIETALALAQLGVESWLLDGRTDGALARALTGERIVGTRVPACDSRPSPRPETGGEGRHGRAS